MVLLSWLSVPWVDAPAGLDASSAAAVHAGGILLYLAYNDLNFRLHSMVTSVFVERAAADVCGPLCMHQALEAREWLLGWGLLLSPLSLGVEHGAAMCQQQIIWRSSCLTRLQHPGCAAVIIVYRVVNRIVNRNLQSGLLPQSAGVH